MSFSNKVVNLENFWDEEETRIDLKVYTTRRDIPIYIMNVKPFIHIVDGFLTAERQDENASSVYIDQDIVLYFEIVPVTRHVKHYDYD